MSYRISSVPMSRAGKTLPIVLLLSATVLRAATAAEKGPADQRPSASPAAVQKLTLAQCIQLALAHQPRIAARRASLAAAEDRSGALEALRAPECLAPELPFRRTQASLGVSAAR